MVPKERSNMLKYDQIVPTHNKARKKPFKTCFRTGFSMNNDIPESCWVEYIIPKLIHQPSIMSQLYQICVHMLIIKIHIKQLSSSTNHSQSPLPIINGDFYGVVQSIHVVFDTKLVFRAMQGFSACAWLPSDPLHHLPQFASSLLHLCLESNIAA